MKSIVFSCWISVCKAGDQEKYWIQLLNFGS
jgi:hypothetical protein